MQEHLDSGAVPKGERPVEQLLYDRIRINVRTLAEDKPYATLPISRRDIDTIHADSDITRFELPKPERGVARIVWRIRRLLYRLLFPLLRRQARYTEANTRLVLNLAERLDIVSESLAGLEDRVTLAPHSKAEAGLEVDMFELEERFRGPEAEIAGRQSRYIQHFSGIGLVLDIGCGRGEFLELMRRNGLESRGIDLDPRMIERCREKGLEAVVAEAGSYLGMLEDESLGGVFCAQVIEHMTSDQVVELVRLCARKLKPGGTLVLETPNPESLAVLTTFSLDFTHVRLYHPLAIEWLMRKAGFEVSLDFSVPAGDFDAEALFGPTDNASSELRRLLERTGQIVFGPQTYGAIGVRSAAQAR